LTSPRPLAKAGGHHQSAEEPIVTKPKFIVAAGAALALALAASGAQAQDGGAGPVAGAAQQDRLQEAVTDQNQRTQEETGRNRRNRNSQPPPPTPEELAQRAQALAVASNVNCQVTRANLLGQTPDGALSYEAVCASGPGYILIASTPPQGADCVLLAGQAAIERARDPAADVGAQCAIPENMDVVRVISGYATSAGIACTVDQGASIGKSREDNVIYEVGCAGVDGAWLERLPDGWKITECAQVIVQNGTCRFSTADEQAATLKARFASNAEAAACDVVQARYMGANANGSFHEAKCAAGNGVIVRFNTEFAVQQVYPCETAQRIGGGCTLTIVPAPPAAAPASR
jgi:hypothetical protein